jgi:hypothetical protein
MEQYTERQVTFDQDIINAFLGILRAIPDEFFWAIPLSSFGKYLCWAGSRKSWRAVKTLTWRNLERAPSWSWVAWKEPVLMNYDGSHPTSVVAYFRYTGKALERICRPEKQFTEFTAKCDINKVPKHITLEDNYLIFRASCAQLRIKRQDNGSFLVYPTAPFKASASEAILFHIGEFQLDTDCEVENNSIHDFAVIAIHGGDLFLLMLSWKNGVAYRTCMLALNQLAWKRANPKLKLIILG